jgi:hypothetical protein
MEYIVNASAPTDQTALLEFLKQHPSISYRALSTDDLLATLGTQLRKPTPTFKNFCGSEWLSAKGLITEQDALRRILLHIDVMGLFNSESNRIILDQELTELFGSVQGALYMRDLPSLIQRLFEPLSSV